MVNVTVTTAGTTGPRGNGWLSGTGAPSDTLGLDGDFYVNTAASNTYYGPKTAGSWGSVHTLVGPVQTVNGSWTGGTAGPALAAALANLGLIVNNTTA